MFPSFFLPLSKFPELQRSAVCVNPRVPSDKKKGKCPDTVGYQFSQRGTRIHPALAVGWLPDWL